MQKRAEVSKLAFLHVQDVTELKKGGLHIGSLLCAIKSKLIYLFYFIRFLYHPISEEHYSGQCT